MANDEQVALLKQGVDAWNKWRDENPDIRPDLREANLGGANLTEANLSYEANLGYEPNLSYAYLFMADLSWANLQWADLNGANLERADLSCANLTEANLAYANLREANLGAANLQCQTSTGRDWSGRT